MKMKMLLVLTFCGSIVDGRYEKAIKEGQVQAEHTREWRKLFSISGSSFVLVRGKSVSRTLDRRNQLHKFYLPSSNGTLDLIA